jgi:broad specificity phosphatase PhoE
VAEGTRIVLVRHGESRAQELGILGGHSGCQGLSHLGRRQVTLLRERLAATGELAGASTLYASIMPRAVETAEIIAAAIGGTRRGRSATSVRATPAKQTAFHGRSWSNGSRRRSGRRRRRAEPRAGRRGRR